MIRWKQDHAPATPATRLPGQNTPCGIIHGLPRKQTSMYSPRQATRALFYSTGRNRPAVGHKPQAACSANPAASKKHKEACKKNEPPCTFFYHAYTKWRIFSSRSPGSKSMTGTSTIV